MQQKLTSDLQGDGQQDNFTVNGVFWQEDVVYRPWKAMLLNPKQHSRAF